MYAGKHLAAIRKGDPRKLAIARRLRQEPTISYEGITEQLAMGSWSHVSNLPGATRRTKP
jgi:hypothetical protein